jgi:hypothetical protein
MNKIRLAATVLSALMAFGVLAVAQAQSTAPAAPAAPPAPAAAAAQAKRPGDAGNGWRIKFDRSAKADGVLHFRLWPYNAEPIDINIPVKQGQTENAMARMTSDAFQAALDNNDFASDVKKDFAFVRAKHGNRRFALELLEHPAGTDIDLYRE